MAKHASGPSSGYSSGSLLSGLVVGAALGTLVGMTVSPRQKQQLRRWVERSVQRSAAQMPDWMDGVSRVAQTQGDRLLGAAQQRWGGTLERLRDAVAAGVAASRSDGAPAPSAQFAPVAPDVGVSQRSPASSAGHDQPAHTSPGSETQQSETQHSDGQDESSTLRQRRRNAYGRLQSAGTTPDTPPWAT